MNNTERRDAEMLYMFDKDTAAQMKRARLLLNTLNKADYTDYVAEREPNQVGFDVQISPIPASFPLDILAICPAGKAFGLE